MKPIGLIGGLTYVSTLDYYRHLNEIMNERLGGNEAPKIILYSVNFGEIKKLIDKDDWPGIIRIICEAAQRVEQAGAACLLIGANTMHKIAAEVQAAVNIPVLHIAGEVAKEILSYRMKKVGLLGTRFTMKLNFYKDELARHGIDCITPGDADAAFVNETIFKLFSKNIFLPETKNKYLEIIGDLQQQGAEGIILGCTEIPILLNQADCKIPLFDTAKIHARAAVDFALQ
jgi:aspartate racemase